MLILISKFDILFMEVVMKDKNIKNRYNNVINSFKSKMKDNDRPTILKIERIESEYDNYNKKAIKDKVNLGILILSGAAITIVSTVVLLNDDNFLGIDFVKDLISILGIGYGASVIPISIDDYKRSRLNSNADANKNLEEYEDTIKKEKVNVKKR